MDLTAPAEVLEDPERTEKNCCSFSYSLLFPPYKKQKNRPVRDSIIWADTKATTKEGTNSFPTEDLPFFEIIDFVCSLRVYSAVKLLCP
jgi:hypothetical protein